MSKALEEMMMSISSQIDQEEKSKMAVPDREVQKETLEFFLKTGVPNAELLKVGDLVRLNHFGAKRYKIPNESTLGIVVSVFPAPVVESSNSVVHGEVAVCFNISVVCMTFDFRYLEKAEL